MSAHLTPEELRKVAPDEYARIYGKPAKKPDRADLARMREEVDRLNAETRLLNARKANERAKAREAPKPPKVERGAAAFWVALVIALAQFVFAWYVITHY